MNCTFGSVRGGLSLIAVLAVFMPAANAALISGPWTNAAGQGNGPIHDANTNHPIVGDAVEDPGASSNAADGEMFDSPFPSKTLSDSGDKLIFTGTVALTGTVNSPATSGTPRTQFRFGLFDDDGDGDDLEWVGYLMTNRHGNLGTPSGTLGRKNVGNTNVYLSTTAGTTNLTSVQGDGTAASLFNDDTYSMMMTIERSGNDLLISATLTGSNGFTQSLSATDTNAATLGTYTFDHVGFLLGGNLDTDRAAFSDLQIFSIPEPASGLLAVVSLVAAGFLRRRPDIA